MKTKRNLLTSAAADQLLDAAATGTLTGQHALGTLLSAAAAPPADRELAGEAEAVLAFRSAHLRPAPRSRRPSMSPAKLLAAAVLAAAGVTGSGVALAAATGHMPSDHTARTTAASSAASSSAAKSGTGKTASHPGATPSPSMRGLCQAYTAHAADNPGKALDNPAFSALIAGAGGRADVAGYCAKMLATKPGNAPATHSTGKPAAKGNTTHPTGKPTAHP